MSEIPSPTNIHHFISGAQRADDVDHIRLDLVCPTALQRLGRIYFEGTKYDNGPRSTPNWCKGIPVQNLLNHLENHLAKWKANDSTEDHLAKIAWAIFGIMHYEGCCQHHVRMLRNDSIDEVYLECQKESDKWTTVK